VSYIQIYCDDGHERYLVIAYGRLDDPAFPEGRDWIPQRVWVDGDGRRRLARSHDVHPRRGDPDPLLAPGVPKRNYRYRFHCPRCGFDEQRKEPPDPDSGFADVLDRLAAGGTDEISVRAFVRLVWG
jgi:hypothetical protein